MFKIIKKFFTIKSSIDLEIKDKCSENNSGKKAIERLVKDKKDRDVFRL